MPPYVLGNWKMHLGPAEAAGYCDRFLPLRSRFQGATVGLFPPFVSLAAVAERLSGTGIGLGGQSCHPESHGAYTGEVAAEMLAEAGCRWVLVGHSERRRLCGEDDDAVRARLDAAERARLGPVLCVGETLAQREQHATGRVLRLQCGSALRGRSSLPPGLVLAYEPVWAIGTGLTATVDQARESHAVLQEALADLGIPGAEGVPILYGGSVKPHNVAELVAAEEISGVLVGGASLEPDAFSRLAQEALKGR